eukprot:12458500-Ditylum_brightwellii.AAC.1
MAAVTDMLQQYLLFQGKVYFSLIMTPYHNDIFNLALLEGQLELDKNNWQIPIVWIYCNNFLVHGSTYKDCCKAVAVVMGMPLRLGLLAHPSKIK